MKRVIICLAAVLAAWPALGVWPLGGARPEKPDIVVSDLLLRGTIEGENITFELSFTADVNRRKSELVVLSGAVAYLDGTLPRKAELLRRDERLSLKLRSRGEQAVRLEFAARAVKDGDWRQAQFVLPVANVRRLVIVCDRPDLDVRFPHALNVERHEQSGGVTEVSAFLGVTDTFTVRWKPEVKQLEGELAVTCDVNTIATASVGALRIDTLFTYHIVQGTMKTLAMSLPRGVNITQVRGDDIRDWRIEAGPAGALLITLSRPKEGVYRMQVESERILPELPCSFDLPVFAPRDVIRTSGFLMIGSDSAIKLVVGKAAGVTQVEKTAFPNVRLGASVDSVRTLPKRSSFAYQYASVPYTLTLSADDIVPEYNADDRIVVRLRDNNLFVEASVELDVRDAPAREVTIDVPAGWIVANVASRHMSDYDVRDQGAEQEIRVHFREGLLGRGLIDIRLEKPFPRDSVEFEAPSIAVRGAKAERGFLVLAAEEGLRLKGLVLEGLREVNTASVPVKVPGARHAYRFRDAGWRASIALERTAPTIYAEIFHLVSLGEGILYGSSSITYHIGGAPVRELVVHVPTEFRNIEFTGRDIRSWEQRDGNWLVSLQDKVLGDYTLLVTYDRQFAHESATVSVGGVRTVGSGSEVGYIVLASSATLMLAEESVSPSIIAIERAEIPQEYMLLVNDPILKAYKYVQPPHQLAIQVARFETEQLLMQVVDHASIATDVGDEGESVTTVRYFVKNATRQYLTVALPDDARLWSTQQADEHGKKTTVISKRSGDTILVPLHRPRDPNLPIEIELVYAQDHGAIRALGKRIRLQAPVTPDTQSTFSEWSFSIPDALAVASVSGNMSLRRAMGGNRGLSGAISRVFLAWWTMRAVLAVVIAAMLAGALVTYSFTARWHRVLCPLAAVILVVLGVGVGGFVQAVGYAVPVAERGQVFRPGAPGMAITLTKAVNLTESEALEVGLHLVPGWIGNRGSLPVLALAGLGCVLAAGWTVRGRQRTSGTAAIFVTLAVVALAQFAAGQKAIVLLLGVGVPLFVVWRVLMWAWRRGRARAEQEAEFEDDDELFVPENSASEEPPELPASNEGVPPVAPPDMAPHVKPGPEGEAGHATAAVLSLVCLAALVTGCLATKPVVESVPPTEQADDAVQVVMDSVLFRIEGPAMERETERSATVTMELSFEVDDAVSFRILSDPAVVTGFEGNSRRLSLTTEAGGCTIQTRRKGEYRAVLTYLLPVQEQDGRHVLDLAVPANLKNQVDMTIPETGIEVLSESAVLLRVREVGDTTHVTAAYGPQRTAQLVWKPRARKTKLEETVFFCEVNTYAVFEPGVVELVHLCRYQIAQGEIKEMNMSVPAGMSVTSVRAPGLSTWRFDPDGRMLEAILEKGVSGTLDLVVVTQISCEGLPYEATVQTLVVEGTERQRGAVALATPDSVQISVESQVGFSSMNASDFSAAAVDAARRAGRRAQRVEVKRAFRYHRVPASLRVRAERVLPELHVTEKSSLSIGDERIVLSSQLSVVIVKSGIFTLTLGVPVGYDVETLTGNGISHWDDVGLDGEEPTVLVHFDKQVLGARHINLVLARTEKGIEERVLVPRVAVDRAAKHTGTMIVSAERGVRLTTQVREGVSELNPRVLGLRQPGVLAYKLLRPGWRVLLKTEVLAPVLKPELLQRVDITEGILQGRVYLRYKIENAGCKRFILKAPRPGTALSMAGRHIAKVQEIDAEQGLWRVDLHGKVENRYELTVAYQIPFDPAKGNVSIQPVVAMETEGGKGYLAIMSSGRMQITAQALPQGLTPEDSRSIPPVFNAGDLSDAILCYRTIQPEYVLGLSVMRHGSADVLPAKVRKVRLTSVVAEDGQVLTRAELDLDVGALRFLEVTLPRKENRIWSLFVDGKVATPSRNKEAYRIPLDGRSGESTHVEIIYAGAAGGGRLRKRYVGPRFNLPLTNVEWTLYVPANRRYFGFGGTMKPREEGGAWEDKIFSVKSYAANTRLRQVTDIKKAQSVLAQGERFAREGKQMKAKRAFESAINYSQGKADINEDARIQYQNLMTQNALVGLVNRRNQVRRQQNVQDEQQSDQAAQQIQGGNYNREYAAQLEQSLSVEESDSLRKVAEKILNQQVAAAGVTEAIRVTVPEHGHALRFCRGLQINPNAEMAVTFRSVHARLGRRLFGPLPALILFGLAWAGFRRRAGDGA